FRRSSSWSLPLHPSLQVLFLFFDSDLLLQARDLILKITEERSSIIDQNKRPPQEL
ncbi:hypothetical protein S83_012762, partial [Arachis hypogaea]